MRRGRTDTRWLWLLALPTIALAWFLFSTQGTDRQSDLAAKGAGSPTTPASPPLQAPGESTDRTSRDPSPKQAAPVEEETEVGETDPGAWGSLTGKVTLNGKPAFSSLYWHHPQFDEEDRIESESDGTFGIDLPPGRITFWVVVREWDGIHFIPLESGYGDLTYVQEKVELRIEPGTEHKRDFDLTVIGNWVEGSISSQSTGLALEGIEHSLVTEPSTGVLYSRTNDQGEFRFLVPDTQFHSLRVRTAARDYTFGVERDQWNTIQVPDAHFTFLEILDANTGEPLGQGDYTAYWREANFHRWRPFRQDYSDYQAPSPKDPKTTGRHHVIALPKEAVEIWAAAPLSNLAPIVTKIPDPTLHTEILAIHLPAGGRAQFRATHLPDTGVINDGPDQNPILITAVPGANIETNGFLDWCAQPEIYGAHPLGYYQYQRIEFNRQGLAEVQGLPPGTYALKHWRHNLTWNPGPIQIVANKTTQIQLAK